MSVMVATTSIWLNSTQMNMSVASKQTRRRSKTGLAFAVTTRVSKSSHLPSTGITISMLEHAKKYLWSIWTWSKTSLIHLKHLTAIRMRWRFKASIFITLIVLIWWETIKCSLMWLYINCMTQSSHMKMDESLVSLKGKTGKTSSTSTKSDASKRIKSMAPSWKLIWCRLVSCRIEIQSWPRMILLLNSDTSPLAATRMRTTQRKSNSLQLSENQANLTFIGIVG